jgi:hypothetical protein
MLACFALAAAPGCGKKDEDNKGGDDKETPQAGGDQAGGDQAGGDQAGGDQAAKEKAAADFFKHYNSLKGMEVMEHYKDGVTVTGAITKLITEMDESLGIWIDAGDPNYVSLKFKDKGAAAKEKGVKEGDSVTAKCSIGGAMNNQIMLLDCELK